MFELWTLLQLYFTLTSQKSVPWSVPSFSGRRNYFADALGASGTLRGTLFPCVGRSFHGTLFPWDGRSRGTLFSGLRVLSLYGRTSGPSYFMRTPPEVVGLRGLNMVSGACKYCHNIKEWLFLSNTLKLFAGAEIKTHDTNACIGYLFLFAF